MLERAGWYSDRTFNYAKWGPVLNAHSCVLHPRAADFLSRFGGLTIKGKVTVKFDPTSGLKFIHLPSAIISELVAEMGQPLCLIGHELPIANLFMAADGSVWALWDAFTQRHKSGLDYIEWLAAKQ